MSWFSDIAGKAELFLNKVDQGAATALQKDNVKNSLISAQKTFIPSGIYGENEQAREFINPSVARPEPTTVSEVKSSPERKQGKRSKPVKSKIQNQEDDEKLLEFLNSEKVPTEYKLTNKSAINASKVAKSKSKSDDTKTIKFEDQALSIQSENGSKTPPSDSMNLSSPNGTTPVNEKLVTEDNDVKINVEDVIKTVTSNEEETNTSTASALELENKLLKKEMVSLNQEVGLALKRAKHSDEELSSLKKKYDAQNSQASSMEKILRDLQNKESDLVEAMRAKDTQIAVLRIRIEEADQELRSKQNLHDSIKAQNDRLLKDHSDSSGLQSQVLDSLKIKLSDAETALRLEKESFKSATKEASDRINKLEIERQNMAALMNATDRQLTEEKAKSSELAENSRVARHSYDQAVLQLNEYKQKAQRILQAKDNLISTLQESGGNGDVAGSNLSSTLIELEELRHERESLKEELSQALFKVNTLQADLSDLESSMQNELDTLQKQISMNEEQLLQSGANQKDLEQENSQLKSELRFLRDDLSKIKSSLQSRIQDRDLEIEKLRKQITARSINNSTEAELEARVHSLTESLIHKQTILEAMSTEKNSLNLQLERLSNEVKENRTYTRQNHSVVGINEADEVKARIPVFLRESPFDGHITRKVKRVYNSMDILSVRVGVFLRQYPIARVFILIYMLLLHLWVLIILMTYTPESHTPDNTPHPGPSSQ